MFHFPHYPAFNVADSSIVVGLVAIGAFLLFGPALTGKPKQPEPEVDAD
jgi:lipoprotein signal peptidase